MTQELITELREWRIASAPYEPAYKVPPSDLHLEAAAALERLTAERDALRADAMRYRWLRRVERGLRGWNVMHYAKCYTEKTLDEVIDAAIGEKK